MNKFVYTCGNVTEYYLAEYEDDVYHAIFDDIPLCAIQIYFNDNEREHDEYTMNEVKQYLHGRVTKWNEPEWKKANEFDPPTPLSPSVTARLLSQISNSQCSNSQTCQSTEPKKDNELTKKDNSTELNTEQSITERSITERSITEPNTPESTDYESSTTEVTSLEEAAAIVERNLAMSLCRKYHLNHKTL